MNFQLTNYFVRVIRRSNFTQGQRIADLTRPSLSPHFVKLKAITCNLSTQDHIYFQKKLSSSVKVSHFTVDRSFSNIHYCHLWLLTVQKIHYCHLWLLIVAYHSAKFHKEFFQWIRRTRCITFCAQLRVKMLYFWANRSRLSIFTIANFVYLYSPTTCKISEKSLIWIPRTRCLRSFWPLGIKISHLEAKKSFLIIFTILASTIHRKSQVKSHVIHYFHLSFCKNSKKPLE